MKEWYKSKIIGIGALALLGAVSDGILNGWTWRQWSVAIIGVVTVIVRAVWTQDMIALPGEK